MTYAICTIIALVLLALCLIRYYERRLATVRGILALKEMQAREASAKIEEVK